MEAVPATDHCLVVTRPADHSEDPQLPPEDREALLWLKEVYRGDTMPQLTLRAIIIFAFAPDLLTDLRNVLFGK